ncbi:hypothetical protein LTA6_003419 [Microbacterium sp. LTA6]|uniref:hypothetical protein n=1 Tax=Microbacterium sp. LTA6 TaxID=3129771 RepID=UPI0032481FB3
MIPRISTAAASALLLALVLTACAGAPTDTGTTPTPKASEPAAEASAEPVTTPTPAATSAAPTCETMVSQGTVEALTDEGWTAGVKEFNIGGVPLPQGLLCFWADYTVASDHGQLYGWSQISASDADKAQAALLADGWQREDSSEGVYITEDAEHSMGTDEDGYGMTYLFGDGWVKFADTRQGLILIEWAG